MRVWEQFLAEVIDEPKLKRQVGESQVTKWDRTFFAEGAVCAAAEAQLVGWVGGAAAHVGSGGRLVSLEVALKGCEGWRRARGGPLPPRQGVYAGNPPGTGAEVQAAWCPHGVLH